MTKRKQSKQPWPTKDAMEQIYENNLWGVDKSVYYSGLGSHHPELVNPYLDTLTSFFYCFRSSPGMSIKIITTIQITAF